MYPTLLHRLTGAIITTGSLSKGGRMSDEVVIANRPTYKPVAAIIFFQAFAALSRATAEASIEVVHFVQIAFFRWRRSRRRQIQQLLSSGVRTVRGATTSERAEYMDSIESQVPGIFSYMKHNGPNNVKGKVISGKKKQKARLVQSGLPCCGICLNERVNPSVPSVCGHIFCWACILHWVSNVRAECPLCRAETRRQDIIPLINYP